MEKEWDRDTDIAQDVTYPYPYQAVSVHRTIQRFPVELQPESNEKKILTPALENNQETTRTALKYP